MSGQRLTARADDSPLAPVHSGRQPGPARHGQPGRPGPAGALLQLQRTHGNRYIQRLLQEPAPGPAVQPKLRVGRAGDRSEREADRLAGDLSGDRAGPAVQRAGRLAGAGTARAAGRAVAPADSELILGARGRGQPLPGSLRRRYEQGLGASFAPVRLHTDQQADSLNRRLGSSAFTTGPDLFFRRGAYDPASAAGRELLGHELVHVVQQSADGGGPGLVQLGKNKPKNKPKKKNDQLVPTPKTSSGQQPGVSKPKTKPEPQPKKARQAKLANEVKSGSLKVVPAKGQFVPTLATVPENQAVTANQNKRRNSGTSAPVKKLKLASGEAAERETRAEIPVGYRGMKAMSDYLISQGLMEGAKVRPISVGVVVWNINHLKADQDADDDADVGEDVSLDDEYDDDLDVEGEETDASGYPGTGDLPGQDSRFDTAAITVAMDALKKGLAGAAAPVNKAIAGEIAKLDAPVPGAGTSRGSKGAGGKARSETRREVSQLRRDIEVLISLDLNAVLGPGIAAMGQGTEEAGRSAAEAQAVQLDHIRSLNRVWKRLTRLRAVLFTGKVKSPLKRDARQSMRDALPDAAGRDIAQAITDLLEELPVRRLEAAASSLKRRAVIGLTTETFFANPAVNLVLINEMNLGIKHLESAVAASKRGLGLSKGPVMVARGTEGTGTAGVTVGSGDNEQQVMGKQYEYYPGTHRTQGRGALTSPGTFYVNTRGYFAVQDAGENSNQAIPWNKTEKTFRGIVVHRYVQGGQEFWAGIIHTTPAGKDLDRKRIWPQISVPLRALGALAEKFRIPLLIGGDFYIPAEGIVSKPNPAVRKKIQDSDPTLVLNVKLWNIARNVFLAAEAAGQIPLLLAKVGAAKVEPGQTAGHSRRAWESYCAAVKPEIEDLITGENKAGGKQGAGQATGRKQAAKKATGGKLEPEKALEKLAPGMRLGAGISWKRTIAAGDISGLDIIRNSRDPDARITMERALGPMGYRMVAAGSPTNPKEHGRGDNKMQIADLFIVNQYWQTTHSGIVIPGTSELKTIDDPELSASKTYWKVSDHSPVLMMGSTVAYHADTYQAFSVPSGAANLVTTANQAAWDYIAAQLKGLKTTGIPVADQIAVIRKYLAEPLLGPTRGVTDVVQKLAHSLGTGVLNAMSTVWTPAQQRTVADLGRWAPLYMIDVAGEPLPGMPATSKPGGKDPSPGLLTLPGYVPADLAKPAAPGPGDQEMADDPGPLPTGQMAHGINSCYLAALVHVLASHQHFTDLLDPHKHQPMDPAGVTFQTQSGLHSLVTQLRNPQATISAADTLKFMRYLDEMWTMLTGESGYTRAGEWSKQKTEQDRQKVAAKSAYGLQQDAAEMLTRVLDQLEPPATVKPSIESHLTGLTTNQVSVTPERHTTVSLVIGSGVKSISDALRQYSAVDVVQAGYPETPHLKQLRFGALPEVLTLVLSRFTSIAGSGSQKQQAKKITRPVTVDEELDIPAVSLSPALQGQRARYRLLHMVHHSGTTMAEGHYTSFGRIPATGQWYQHDDNASAQRRTLYGPGIVPAELSTGYVYIYVRI